MHFPKYVIAAAIAGCLVTLPQSSSAGVDGSFTAPRQAALQQSGYLLQISHRSRFRRTVRVTGIITNEGVECTALRGDDGRLYTLAGRIQRAP